VDQALGERSALLFKHSTHCPISANARQEMESLTRGGEPVPVYVLDVDRQDVSEYVAGRTGVEHQSPQVILLRGGRPAWTADRWDITANAIRGELGLAQPGA
jgi:bacillithiol system protein YtxJ